MHDATLGRKRKTRNGAPCGFFQIDVLALAERHLTRTCAKATTHAGATCAHPLRVIARVRPVRQVTVWDRGRYIPGICSISRTSIEPPLVCRCGWLSSAFLTDFIESP